jgi:hypothetical protein
MAKLSATVTTTSTQVVKLSPTVKRKLLMTVKTYAGLKTQRDALDHAMKGHRATVEELLEEAGQTTLDIEGYKTTIIAPVKTKLDPKKLIALGVSADIIEKATISTAGTPYVKITVPGSKKDDDE